MADTPAKRIREAKKRQQQEKKMERKRMRKEGLLGQDNTGLFAPGERPREVVSGAGSMQPPPQQAVMQEEPTEPSLKQGPPAPLR